MHLHHMDGATSPCVSISQIADVPIVGAKKFILVSPGTTVFHQGDAGTDSIFLIKGTMCSYRITKDGDRLISGFFLSGDIFCHSSHGIRMNSIDALSECIFQRLTPAALDALVVAGIYGRQLDRLANEEWNMSSGLLYRLHMTADQRVADFILDIAQRSGAPIGDNSPVKLQMSRTEIASYLGLTTETVVRSLKRLAMEGMFIAITPHDYRIRDLKKLRQLAKV